MALSEIPGGFEEYDTRHSVPGSLPNAGRFGQPWRSTEPWRPVPGRWRVRVMIRDYFTHEIRGGAETVVQPPVHHIGIRWESGRALIEIALANGLTLPITAPGSWNPTELHTLDFEMEQLEDVS